MKVLRQTKALLFIGLINAPIALGRALALATNESTFELVRDLLVFGVTTAAVVVLVLGHWMKSITVTEHTITFKAWTSATEIPTHSFVDIVGGWFRGRPVVMTTGENLRAPWYHPNLAQAITKAVAEQQPPPALPGMRWLDQ